MAGVLGADHGFWAVVMMVVAPGLGRVIARNYIFSLIWRC